MYKKRNAELSWWLTLQAWTCVLLKTSYIFTHIDPHHLNDYIGFALNFLIPSFQIKEGWTKGPPLSSCGDVFSDRIVKWWVLHLCLFVPQNQGHVHCHEYSTHEYSICIDSIEVDICIFSWASATFSLKLLQVLSVPSVLYYFVALLLSF